MLFIYWYKLEYSPKMLIWLEFNILSPELYGSETPSPRASLEYLGLISLGNKSNLHELS